MDCPRAVFHLGNAHRMWGTLVVPLTYIAKPVTQHCTAHREFVAPNSMGALAVDRGAQTLSRREHRMKILLENIKLGKIK